MQNETFNDFVLTRLAVFPTLAQLSGYPELKHVFFPPFSLYSYG